MSIETVTPLGLILNELITNAIKHAFPDTVKDKKIHISLLKEGKSLVMTVTDNGKGITNEIKDSSFGIKLIKALSKKLKATVVYENQIPQGTKAIVICTRFNEL